MTSPDPRGRETGEMLLAYSGGSIDRAANQRSDPGFLDATLAKASTRLIPMWRDHCVVSGEPPVPVIVSAAEARAVLAEFDDFARHYEVAYDGVSAPPSASSVRARARGV